MYYEKYILDYHAFLEKWRAVKQRNERGDYSCGTAIVGASCDSVIVFENETEKANYKTAYGF